MIQKKENVSSVPFANIPSGALMNSATKLPSTPPPETRWEPSLTADEWDALYPGILDGVIGLAGSANVIMQLSRLNVGYGVKESRVESGSLFKRPLKRARTTFTYLAVALMGTPEEKLAYRQAVNRSHAQVRSTASSPTPYNAFDPELQLWVAACLYWGIADTYQRIHGPMTKEKASRFYQLAQPLGTTLQVRSSMWPADLDAFNAYWEENLARLRLDDTIRSYLMALVDLKFLHPLLRPGPVQRFHRFMTTGFLPAHLREEMHLSWDAKQQAQFERTLSGLETINRLMPQVIRQLPMRFVLWDFRRRLRNNQPLV